MSKSAVTLKDIAERTGVSKVTVSYVLNGRETRVRISDATKKRVTDMAHELGYQPNYAARSLARRCSDTITLVMQSPRVFSGGSGFINEMMQGVLDAANHAGYDLLLHTKSVPTMREELSSLTDGRADGLLVLRDLGDPLVESLAERGFPFVCLYSRSDLANVCYVDCDNVRGGFDATHYLFQQGHRRIGFVGGAESSSAVRDRFQGYADAHAAQDVPLDPALRVTMTFSGADGLPLVEMMRRPDRPTALFVWSDDVAVATMFKLREELGITVPRDVSLVGFDGMPLICDRSTPPLTSIRQPIYAIAERAMAMLVARIRKQDVPASKVLLPPELVVRQSVAAHKELP